MNGCVGHGSFYKTRAGTSWSTVMRWIRRAVARRVRQLAEVGDYDRIAWELRQYEATRCGAKTRRDTPCRRRARRNGRCPNHGGLSTGPRTPMGRLLSLQHLKQYRGLSLEELEQRLVEAEMRKAG